MILNRELHLNKSGSLLAWNTHEEIAQLATNENQYGPWLTIGFLLSDQETILGASSFSEFKVDGCY